MSKTIGIVGTRRRNSLKDYKKVKRKFLFLYEKGDTICSGKCPKGGDKFAVIFQKKYRTKKKWFRARWDLYGNIAGFIRNTPIAEHSDVLIACVAKDRTGGTEDTVRKFVKFHGRKNLHLV